MVGVEGRRARRVADRWAERRGRDQGWVWDGVGVGVGVGDGDGEGGKGMVVVVWGLYDVGGWVVRVREGGREEVS